MEDTAVQLAIKNANDALEIKIDGKLGAMNKDFHGRLDRMSDAQTKFGEDVLTEIKASNLNVTQEFKAVTKETSEILRAQIEMTGTSELLALKIDENEKDTIDNKKSIGTIWKAGGVIALMLLTAFVGWLFSLINTPTP